MTMLLTPQEFPTPAVVNSLFPFNPSLDDEMKRLFGNFLLSVAPAGVPGPNADDVMEEFRHNGRDYEYCPELDVTPAPNPRRKKNKKPLPSECAFCKNNGEEATFYRSHFLKDADGRVECPVLRAYRCPICGVRGDNSHTIKHCPVNKNPEAVATANALKALRNSSGKRRCSKLSVGCK